MSSYFDKYSPSLAIAGLFIAHRTLQRESLIADHWLLLVAFLE